MIFLIEYDRPQGLIIRKKYFNDSDKDAAQAARLIWELERHSQGKDREIVILEAESEAAVHRTHRRYFEKLAQLVTEFRFAS